MKVLIEKYLRHEATESERKQICQWLEEDGAVAEWFEGECISMNEEMPSDVKQRIYESVCGDSEKEEQNQNRFFPVYKRYYLWAAVACLLVAVVALGGGYFLGTCDYPSMPLAVYTNVGDKSRVTLPDGTTVDLNSMSRLTYYYDEEKDSRVVNLTGEAYFDVAKDTSHPFYVQAGDVKIECLGTKFNVNAYSEQSYISVVLADGKVRLVTTREDMLMHPNSMIRYDKFGGTMHKEKVEALNYCEWMNGYVYFNNERFEDIIKVVARDYGVTININSPQLREERFTGSVYQADLQKILNILAAASGARYEYINDTFINLTY